MSTKIRFSKIGRAVGYCSGDRLGKQYIPATYGVWVDGVKVGEITGTTRRCMERSSWCGRVQLPGTDPIVEYGWTYRMVKSAVATKIALRLADAVIGDRMSVPHLQRVRSVFVDAGQLRRDVESLEADRDAEILAHAETREQADTTVNTLRKVQMTLDDAIEHLRSLTGNVEGLASAEFRRDSWPDLETAREAAAAFLATVDKAVRS